MARGLAAVTKAAAVGVGIVAFFSSECAPLFNIDKRFFTNFSQPGFQFFVIFLVV